MVAVGPGRGASKGQSDQAITLDQCDKSSPTGKKKKEKIVKTLFVNSSIREI